MLNFEGAEYACCFFYTLTLPIKCLTFVHLANVKMRIQQDDFILIAFITICLNIFARTATMSQEQLHFCRNKGLTVMAVNVKTTS